MTTAAGVGGAVLAGGESRRMGTDKAMLEIDGVALVRTAADALVAAGADPVVVVGGDADALAGLGLVPVADHWPGAGPLGGIITALEHLDSEVVVVLSCDLTDASPSAVRAVVAGRGDADLCVPVVAGRAQWLHTAWHRRCLPTLHAAFAAGVRAPRLAVTELAVARVTGGDPRWFHDADTPDDLRIHE